MMADVDFGKILPGLNNNLTQDTVMGHYSSSYDCCSWKYIYYNVYIL
jgi:hypothetical protein